MTSYELARADERELAPDLLVLDEAQRLKVRIRAKPESAVKKGHLIEQALPHHLSALEELPAEYIITPRLVVSPETGADLLGRAKSKEPTPALRDLMRDGD